MWAQFIRDSMPRVSRISAIFGLLVAGCNVSGSEALPVICGFGIAFFMVYQIFDAVRSARALQAGLPPPDPYGLAASFGGGTGFGGGATRTDSPSRIPVSAIVLILLGALFLLHTAGLFEHGFDRFWPLLLMGLGAWLFARNYGLLGPVGDPRACRRRLLGPVMLFTVGTLCLLDTLNVVGFHRTWPVLLLVVGGAKLIQGSDSGLGYAPSTGAASAGTGFVPPPVPPPPAVSTPAPSSEPKPGEVNNG